VLIGANDRGHGYHTDECRLLGIPFAAARRRRLAECPVTRQGAHSRARSTCSTTSYEWGLLQQKMVEEEEDRGSSHKCHHLG